MAKSRSRSRSSLIHGRSLALYARSDGSPVPTSSWAFSGAFSQPSMLNRQSFHFPGAMT